ncbi:DUF438 domain-containing protein [Thermosphaera sp.]
MVKALNNVSREKSEIVKNLLKRIHEGESFEELKKEFSHILSQITPFEIVTVEQELVREGVPINDILRMCDIHLELFKNALASRQLKGIPKGHPLDLLIAENDEILKTSEALSLYAGVLARALKEGDAGEASKALTSLKSLITAVKNQLRSHYRKNQMVLFPYLERKGISAIPRVLWGREDQVIVKLRELMNLLDKAAENPLSQESVKVSETITQLSRDIADLVFRENKILYPALQVLLSESEWAAVDKVARKLGFFVKQDKGEWAPSEQPKYPYEVVAEITPKQAEELPEELKGVISSTSFPPDTYTIVREGDLEFETGFLTREEVEALFKSLPLEMTYADVNNRVRFFSESSISGGFPRAKTILGRRLEYCHPPRLEQYVARNVEALKTGKEKYRVFWTRLGDRIIRVLLVAVRKPDGELLGVAEIVEDFTEVLNNPSEIMKKIVVL